MNFEIFKYLRVTNSNVFKLNRKIMYLPNTCEMH